MLPLPGIHALLLVSDVPVLDVLPIIYHPYPLGICLSFTLHAKCHFILGNLVVIITPLLLASFLWRSFLDTWGTLSPVSLHGSAPLLQSTTQLLQGLGLCPYPQSQPSNVEGVAPRFSYENSTRFSPFHMKPFVYPSSFPYCRHWERFLHFLL